MSEGESHLSVTPLDDSPGVEIVDQIERRRYEIHTDEKVVPTPVSTDTFQFPVGSAVSITASELVLPRVVGVYVRDSTGAMVAEVEHLDTVSLSEGEYTLELSTQIKTYIEVKGPVDITADMMQTRIEFESPTNVRLGGRSRHKRPAATITTTPNPRDMMRAVEAFGSALKTADPERSYPTLRGHPPAVELGETLDIPSELQRSETGIRLELPPTRSAVYVAAPLAYYLGAELVPGPAPRLTTETGFEYAFGQNSFETEIERTLKQVFFLDCVTRTEGYYNIDLHERSAVEPLLDIDFETLYERSLPEQVAAYLDVPFERIEEYVPQWRLSAHVEPVPDSIEQLPFIVNDLAIVRTPDSRQGTTPASAPRISQEFTRDEVITRSAAEPQTSDEQSYVEPEPSDALEQAWIGDSIPIGASKLTTEAFRNRFDRESTDGDISITIVLNDTRMDEERDLVDRAYGDRDNLPFDVHVHRNLSVSQFREVLHEQTDFLHYIGHTETDGFECTDGKLDARTIDEAGVDSFLLNSCNSYEQGLALIEAGAIGGIVTLSEVLNEGAVRIGETSARLLNAGFPLRAALSIARDESVLGGQYIVVGDGGMTVTQPASLTPYLITLHRNEEKYEFELQTYATDQTGIGSVFMPYMEDQDEYFLASGSFGTFKLSEDEFFQFLQLEEVPVQINGELYWGNSLNPDDMP